MLLNLEKKIEYYEALTNNFKILNSILKELDLTSNTSRNNNNVFISMPDGEFLVSYIVTHRGFYVNHHLTVDKNDLRDRLKSIYAEKKKSYKKAG